MDFSELQITVQQYFVNGLAPLTRKSYQAGQSRYHHFCQQLNVRPIPTSERVLLMFMSHLAKEGIDHTTIKVYLAAIHYLHISVGMHQTYNQQLSPYLELVIKGIKKEQLHGKPQRQRLPITFSIMASMYTVLAHSPNDYHSIMIWAACCTAFFGVLRCSEFTVPSLQGFDPEVHLTIKDITIDKIVEPSLLCVTIKQSKIDPFRQGIHLFLGGTEHTVCPVKALLPYLVLRGRKDSPLFITAKSTP